MESLKARGAGAALARSSVAYVHDAVSIDADSVEINCKGLTIDEDVDAINGRTTPSMGPGGSIGGDDAAPPGSTKLP